MPDPGRPSRTLTSLPPRQLPADPTTSRLRADRRSAAADPPVETPQPQPPAAARVQTAESPSSLPRYLQLVRKESRLRQDQAEELSREVRRLNQARRGVDGGTQGERITDNTLIRVAVDLLLSRVGQLSGHTEEELRNSLSL